MPHKLNRIIVLTGFPMMPPQNGGFPMPMTAAMFDPALLSRKRLSGDGTGDAHRPEVKKPRNMRILKDEPVPDGYIRFRYNKEYAPYGLLSFLSNSLFSAAAWTRLSYQSNICSAHTVLFMIVYIAKLNCSSSV